jgi:hypothetical protein
MGVYIDQIRMHVGWWSGSSGRVPASKREALSSNPSTTKKNQNSLTKALCKVWDHLVEKGIPTVARER